MPNTCTIEPFDRTKSKWSRWVERLEEAFTILKTTEEEKPTLLLHYMGQETYATISYKLAPEKPKDKTYAEIVKVLEAHFNPKPLEIVENYRFHLRKQNEGESVDEFMVALRKIAIHCNFGEYLKMALRNQLVFGIRSTVTRNRLLEVRDLTLEKALDMAAATEMSVKGEAEIHNKPTESFSCKFCDKKMTSRLGLRGHIKIHTRENLLKCPECDKEFTLRHTLKQHLQTHVKDRLKFSCKFCDRKLASKDGLTQHMKYHTRENLFECFECNKEFILKKNLNRHLKTHSKVRLQFSCKFCDSKLLTTEGFKQHMKIHTRENLFKCSVCNREFTTKQCLERHLKTHEKQRLRKILQTSSEKTGVLLSDVDANSMNECTTALSTTIKSEKIGLVETVLTEYINTEPNIEEIESSYLAYNTCYNESICKEEVMLPEENL